MQKDTSLNAVSVALFDINPYKLLDRVHVLVMQVYNITYPSRACILIAVLFIISGVALNIKAVYNLSKEWVPFLKVNSCQYFI